MDIDKLRQRALSTPRFDRMLADYAAAEHDRFLAKEARDNASRGSKRLGENTQEWLAVYWYATLVLAREGDFEAYMLYLEKNRNPAERFYMPRRAQLQPAVKVIQDLLDDRLDEGYISMPPRVGKTTLLMFLLTYVIALRPDSSNLYSAFSDFITNAMYAGVLEVIRDPTTYAWQEIFPQAKIAFTNAKDETLDIERSKRYHSLTARSLYGTLNGACDCNGFLIADDLLSGVEEALNPDRLSKAWILTDNNLLARCKQGAKKLFVGTRWATKDPAGIRMSMLDENTDFRSLRWESINMPALNEKDESNFDYKFGVGFNTDFYKQRRASFESVGDEASWLAQYMGQPIDRIGTLIQPEDIRTYNGELPEIEPDAILEACDVAWGGGDYLCSMVGYVYGSEVYIPSILFTKADKYVTRPLVADQIEKFGVRRAQFEKNNGGDEFREWVSNELASRGYHSTITSKAAPTNVGKTQRILERAPEIREFYFLEPALRDADYRLFMANLLSYSIEGKNKHDDAPDCAAQLASMVNVRTVRARVLKRRF